MKTIIKKAFIWLGLSILMMILWIAGIFIGNMIFPSSLMDQAPESNNNFEWIFLLVCAMNTAVILYLINRSRFKGLKLAGAVFLVMFGIQYFMSQMETVWFNDSLKLPGNGILAIVSGGLFMALLFSPAAVLLTGNFTPHYEPPAGKAKFELTPMVVRIILLSLIVWPLIYFLAGYLVAWQFEAVRSYYSGSTEMASFLSIMQDNFASGLYFFQIFRGVMWILIGLLVLNMTTGLLIHKGVMLGLLIAILGSSGLLIPNPVMPPMVRIAHLIETAPSSFIWGFIIAWSFWKFTTENVNTIPLNNPIGE